MNSPFPFAIWPNNLQKAYDKNGWKRMGFDDQLMRVAMATRTKALNEKNKIRSNRSWQKFMVMLNDMKPEQHQQILHHVGGVDDLYPMEYTHLAPASLLPEVDDPNDRLRAQQAQQAQARSQSMQMPRPPAPPRP